MIEEWNLAELTAGAKVGSILVIPMLWNAENTALEKTARKCGVHTADISANVQEQFNRANGAIAVCWRIDAQAVREGVLHRKTGTALVLDADPQSKMELGDIVIYRFNTGVAFACLVVTYSRMELLEKICHPGYAEGDCIFCFENEQEPVLLERQLALWLRGYGLETFYPGDALFLEAYVYSLAVAKHRFAALEQMQQITFNMHLMAALEEPASDTSEEDVDYVYAVKDQLKNSYRWGCCVSSQTISYITADEQQDFEAELEMQIQDGLPIVCLALYEKYTCLYYGRLLAEETPKKVRRIKYLKRGMLRFKAYGTVSPETISRWYNVRTIYAHLIEFFGVQAAIEEIGAQIEMLSDAQKQAEESVTNTIMGAIGLFGVVSILDSLLSIYEVLSGGNAVEWYLFRMFGAGLVVLTAAAVLICRGYEHKDHPRS